jgi:hypothetical protein
MATEQTVVETDDPYVLKAIELAQEILGVTPVFDPNYDLSQVNFNERVQVRIDKNNAPKEMVERYTWQMSDSRFPPMVVTEDNVMTDGNTRGLAHRQREERFVHALVLPVSRHGADDVTIQRLELYGQALNAVNGKPLDKNEQRKMVYRSIRLGRTNRETQVSAGVKPVLVTEVRHEIEGEDKLLRVGLPVDLVSGATLRALGTIADLNDQPFAELAQLAADAGFNVGEIKALAASVRETGSDELSLERIAKERDANATRITQRESGENGHPPASRQLRQRLGYINSRPAEAFVETNVEIMSDYLSDLQQTVAILNETIKLQAARVEEVAAS